MLENAMVALGEEQYEEYDEFLYDDDLLLEWAFDTDVDIDAFMYDICGKNSTNAHAARWFVEDSNVRDITVSLSEDTMADMIRKYIDDYDMVLREYINYCMHYNS